MLGFKSIKAALLISMLGFVGLSATTQAIATCNLVSTKDSTPLAVKAIDTDTPEAKSFLETCINPYTKKYAANPDLIKAGGKKLFGYNGCSGCHGARPAAVTGGDSRVPLGHTCLPRAVHHRGENSFS